MLCLMATCVLSHGKNYSYHEHTSIQENIRYMGRKSKNHSKSASRNTNSSEIVKFYFSDVITAPLVAGKFTRDLNPTNYSGVSGRLGAIADGFEFFRVKSLRIRLHPAISAPTSFLSAAFIPGVVDTAPTLNDLIQTPSHCMLGGRTTTPSRWASYRGVALATYATWLKTVPGSLDAAEESPGFIYICGNGTDAFLLELQVSYEFRVPVAPGNTPAIRAEREASRDRERLVALGFICTTTAQPKPAPAARPPPH